MGECDQRAAERLSYQCLYKQERGSDVEFEVGPEGQTWRLTAHRRVLAASSPVLRAMMFGPLAHRRGTTVEIRDIEPRAFDCLLRYAYGHPPQFQTVSTALSTLHVAHKYLCPGLEWECAAFLNEQVQTRPDCALEVFQATSFYCQTKEVMEPTAPPAEDIESAEESEGCRLMDSPRRRSMMTAAGESGRRSNSDWNVAMGKASTRLRHNCLQTIDQFANDILALEQLEDLDQESLLAVISRDSFAVSSEVAVFTAVERWAECECKRLKLPHSSEALREAVGGSTVICSGKVARLLLLSAQEFAEGPVRSPLLTAEEQKVLLVHLVGNSPWNQDTSTSILEYIEWSQLSRPRVARPPTYLPIASLQYPGRCEGSPCKTRNSKCWRSWWPCRRKKTKTKQASVKEKERKKLDEDQSKSEKPLCFSKTCDYLIILIACLFD